MTIHKEKNANMLVDTVEVVDLMTIRINAINAAAASIIAKVMRFVISSAASDAFERSESYTPEFNVITPKVTPTVITITNDISYALEQMNGNFISEATYNEVMQALYAIKSKEKSAEETKEAVEPNNADNNKITKKLSSDSVVQGHPSKIFSTSPKNATPNSASLVRQDNKSTTKKI